MIATRAVQFAIAAIAATVVGIAIVTAAPPRAHSASRAYVSVAGEPKLGAVTTATSRSPNRVGFVLVPPASETPPLTAQQALDVVWPVEGAPGHPTTVTAEYGDLNWPDFRKRADPVWIFTYRPRSCQPTYGPPPGTPCIVANYRTIASASTGAFIASYVERSANGATN